METLNSVVQYNSKLAGRDKLYRLLQYTVKLISHISKQNGAEEETLKRLKKLDGVFSLTRKSLRLGKTLDNILGAYKAESIKDPILKWLIISSRLVGACFTYYDNMTWAAQAGIVSESSKAMYSSIGDPLWTLNICINLLRDLYELYKVRQICEKSRKDFCKYLPEFHRDVLLDIIRNISDLIVSLNLWTNVGFSQGFVGILGMVSSVMSIIELQNPNYKLTPS